MGGAPSLERVYSDSASPDTMSGDDDRWPSGEYYTMSAPWHFTDDEYGGQPCEMGAPMDGGCPVRQVFVFIGLARNRSRSTEMQGAFL